MAATVLLVPALGRAQEVGSLAGRVTDANSSLPVPDVTVRIDDVGGAITDEDGLFRIPNVPEGSHDLAIVHVSYGRHVESVTVVGGQETVVAIAVTTEAIELTPIIVEALSELERRRLGSGSSINEIGAEKIDAAARAGMNLGDLVEAELPGVWTRPGDMSGMCVTYRSPRNTNALRDVCDNIAVRIDDVPVSDPATVYASLPLRDIERIEVLSPGQAGVRYGMSAGQGVLLIETKHEEARRTNDASRYLTGFGWEGESEPYRWKIVMLSSVTTNALTVGTSLLLADRCFWAPESMPLALHTTCGPVGTAAASILTVVAPAIVGSLVTRRAGATDRSVGRAIPSIAASAMMLGGGYLMFVGGRGAMRAGGAVVLAVGVPFMQILTDRSLRILR